MVGTRIAARNRAAYYFDVNDIYRTAIISIASRTRVYVRSHVSTQKIFSRHTALRATITPLVYLAISFRARAPERGILNSGAQILTGKINRESRRAYFTSELLARGCFTKITRQHTARINYRVQGAREEEEREGGEGEKLGGRIGNSIGRAGVTSGIEFIAAAYFRRLKGIFIRARANLSRKAFYRLCSIGHS